MSKIYEGYANLYNETLNHPFDMSLFLYPTLELATYYADRAGQMRESLVGGKPQRVRIEVLDETTTDHSDPGGRSDVPKVGEAGQVPAEGIQDNQSQGVSIGFDSRSGSRCETWG